jgi:HSP20 family protein
MTMSKDLQHQQKEKAERVQSKPYVTPRVDVFENNDEVLLLADLPGVQQDGLTLHLDEDQIDLEGAVTANSPQAAAIGREFRPFDFRRSFAMPQGIDREKVSAELKNGVLWLHLPKSPAAKPRRIAVTAS